MDNFISDLLDHCTEPLAPVHDPKETEHFLRLEQQFIDRMGYDFVMEYQAAADELLAREFEAAFLSGLRFSAQFLCRVFPPQSPSSSAP